MALINKFVAIANGIRTLDDSTEKYSLDEMASSIDEANAEIDTQAAKIVELSTILEGKASGSSGAVETCTVELTSHVDTFIVAYTVYENGQFDVRGHIGTYPFNNAMNPTKQAVLENVVCGSAIYINNQYDLNGITVSGGVETVVQGASLGGILFKAPIVAGSIGVIDIYDND